MRSSLLLFSAILVGGCVPEAAEEGLIGPPLEYTETGVVRSVDVNSGSADDPPPPADVPMKTYLLPPEPVLFRLGAGLGALGRVDLDPCRYRGLPSGYLHLRVTFRRGGRVVRAAVETPNEPPADALACVSERLSDAEVPGFDGGEVTLSRSFYVAAAPETRAF